MTSGSTPMESNCLSERVRSTIASAVQRSRLNPRTIKAEGTVLRGDLLQHSSAKSPAYSTVLSSATALFVTPHDSPRTRPLPPPLAFFCCERSVATRHRTPQNLAVPDRRAAQHPRPPTAANWQAACAFLTARQFLRRSAPCARHPKARRFRWGDEKMPGI